MLKILTNNLLTWSQSRPEAIETGFYSILIIISCWLLFRITMSIVRHQTEDEHKIYLWRKGSTYIFTLLTIIFVGRLWFTGIQSLATFLGLLSAGLAIAFRDVFTNMAGWLYIIWEHPFYLGHRIQVGEHAGDVLDIGVFKFTLLEVSKDHAGQSSGRLLHIPNSKVFQIPITNATVGFNYIWCELPILVTFESDWQQAKTIMQEIVTKQLDSTTKDIQKQLKKAKRKYMVHYTNLTPIVYTNIKESGVQLTIRYLAEPKSQRTTQHNLSEAILDIISKKDTINLAYPTTRFYQT